MDAVRNRGGVVYMSSVNARLHSLYRHVLEQKPGQ